MEVSIFDMRVPRREHRSVAFPPVAGTCLAGGLTQLIVCDESVLPGVRMPEEQRQPMFMLTIAGQETLALTGRIVVCRTGGLVAMAAGRWSCTIDGPRPHHSLLLSGQGPWFSRLDLDLASAGGALSDPEPPAAVAAAMHAVVAQAVERPAGWDWAVLAGFGAIAAHVASLALRGGGTMVERLGRLVDGAPAESWRLAQAARALGLGVPSLIHGFRSETGEGPASWIRRRRMVHARRLLLSGRRPTDVAVTLGFPDLARFSRTYRTTMGSWPSAVKAD